MCLRNLVRVSLLTNIKFEMDEKPAHNCPAVSFSCVCMKRTFYELITSAHRDCKHIKKILDLRNSCYNMKSVGCYTRKPVVNVLHTVCKDEHVYPTLLLSIRLIDPLATSKFSRLN